MAQGNYMTKIRFHPQVWINDLACEVSPQGLTDFEVSASEADGGEPYTSKELTVCNGCLQ